MSHIGTSELIDSKSIDFHHKTMQNACHNSLEQEPDAERGKNKRWLNGQETNDGSSGAISSENKQTHVSASIGVSI